jgi:hypothetical protein
MELLGMHRFRDDPEWGQLLLRFRNGEPHINDINKINTRVIKNQEILPYDVKYATYLNKNRDSINAGIFEEYALYSSTNSSLQNFIIVLSDKLKVKLNNVFVDFSLATYFYQNCSESDTDTYRGAKVDPVLKLYKSCQVMFTQNIDVPNGLANGTQATVDNIHLKPGAQPFPMKLLNKELSIQCVFASDVDYISLLHNNPAFSHNIIQLKPKTLTFTAKLPIPDELHTHSDHILFTNKSIRKKKQMKLFPMQCNQLPIIINNATTGHKLQGSTVNNLFVHGWDYETKNWPYVILSRIKKLSGLYLKTPLSTDLNKYAMHPELNDFLQSMEKLMPPLIEYSQFDQIDAET